MIDGLQPGDRPRNLGERNLIVRIEPSGVRSWYCQVNGKRQRIGDARTMKLHEARDIVDCGVVGVPCLRRYRYRT